MQQLNLQRRSKMGKKVDKIKPDIKTVFIKNIGHVIIPLRNTKEDIINIVNRLRIFRNLSLSITVTLYTDDVDKPDITVSLQTYSNTSP